MSDYPNIEAIASGTISGSFSEWPRVRSEAKLILAEVERLKSYIRLQASLRGNYLRVEDLRDGLPRLSTPEEALRALGAGQRLVKMREIR